METKRFDKIAETLISETLPNGLTINIVPRPEFNKSYAMFATNYGGADRRFKLGGQWIDTPAGVAHFLEHKVFDMPYGNALNELSANGASPNAFTSSGITAYHFECTDLFYENLKILLEFVSTPYFTAESVQKEQGIIGQEIRMVEDSPGYVVYNNLLRCLYASNPVRDSVAGTVESIAEITDETLNHCHSMFYNPSNMTLAVVGNVDPSKVIAMARDILPSEGGEVPKRDYGEPETGIPEPKQKTVAMEVSAPQFLFGCVMKPESGRDRLKQMLTGEIALKLLLGRSSPLFNALYTEGLINGGFDYELDYTAGTAMLMVGGESRDVDTLMARFREYVSTICRDGIDSGAFENIMKAKYGNELRAAASFSTLAHALSAGAFANFCPLDSFDILTEITAADVLAFISTNMSDDKIALSVITPNTTE